MRSGPQSSGPVSPSVCSQTFWMQVSFRSPWMQHHHKACNVRDTGYGLTLLALPIALISRSGRHRCRLYLPILRCVSSSRSALGSFQWPTISVARATGTNTTEHAQGPPSLLCHCCRNDLPTKAASCQCHAAIKDEAGQAEHQLGIYISLQLVPVRAGITRLPPCVVRHAFLQHTPCCLHARRRSCYRPSGCLMHRCFLSYLLSYLHRLLSPLTIRLVKISILVR